MKDFSKEEVDGIVKIHCPSVLDAGAAAVLSMEMESILKTPSQCYVLDFTEVSMVTRDFYKIMIKLKSTLKSDLKSLYSVQVSPPVYRQLVDDGLDQVFLPLKSIEEVIAREKRSSSAKAPKSGLDVNFVNAFLMAAVSTFEVQCRTMLKQLKPHMKKDPMPNVAIAGAIELNSDNYKGNIVLCFPEKVFLQIYESLLGEKQDKITEEVQDAAGELLNIISGLAKTELNQKGYSFKKALPKVLIGETLKARQERNFPCLVVPFAIESGPFQIEVEFHDH